MRAATIAIGFAAPSWILSGCTVFVQPPLAPFVTTFYNRNRDGVVDFELHEQPQMADDAWALCDLDFNAVYDLKIHYSVSVVPERTSARCPETCGSLPANHRCLESRDIANRSNQAMQLTASMRDVHAWSVCRRERKVRGVHSGLAAADLVSR